MEVSQRPNLWGFFVFCFFSIFLVQHNLLFGILASGESLPQVLEVKSLDPCQHRDQPGISWPRRDSSGGGTGEGAGEGRQVAVFQGKE